MSISMSKKLFGTAAAAGLIVALAGCGTAPDDESTAGAGGEVVEGFKPCMVSDEGGFDDRSFNQLGFEGLERAADELEIDYAFTESASPSDYASNLDGLVAEGCTLIVSVGFALSAPTVEAALANPDVDFAIIDDLADNDFDGETDAPNIKPLVFDAAQASFLGGYAAASFSETGRVGTFGGQQYPSVTVFMDGFAEGVAYYNEQNGTDVEVVGWDVESQTGQFTNGFAANDTARQVAQGIIDQDADVLLPVGGPIYQSAAEAIRDSGGGIAMLGVDADLYETDNSVQDLLLLSILKGMDVAVYEAVMEAATGEFDTTPFIGVLENDGVGISPFHDFESEVDPGLAEELEEIRQGIIDGTIDASSVSSPVQS